MIELENVSMTYPGGNQALKNVNINIEKGEFVFIVGASGAGKTTLLQILGTILKPDGGSVLINGTDVFALSSNELAEFRNRKIGFVFQFHHLLPEFTAIENVMMPALILKSEHTGNALGTREIKERALSLLAELGLSGKESSRPSEMSGGEQQRVAIARALMNNPDIIFADEPSGNLDSKTKQELHDLFFKLRDAHGQTIIIVTHDASMADRSDKILEIKDGQFVTQ